jgi:plastocyanin
MMRMIITTTDGLKSEAFIPTTTSGVADRGWRTLTIPLPAITGFDRTNKQVASVAFSGDATSTFYLGELRVINDTTPLRVEPSVREMNLAAGDTVTLTAFGTGGATVLKYTWDFDSNDGIQVDSEGQVISRRFRVPGTYTVTVTVSDTYGLKSPFSTTIRVVVNG